VSTCVTKWKASNVRALCVYACAHALYISYTHIYIFCLTYIYIYTYIYIKHEIKYIANNFYITYSCNIHALKMDILHFSKVSCILNLPIA